MGALAMGVLGSAAAFATVRAFSRSVIDDSLDVFACHGVGGIVGSLLTGLFATTTVNPAGADGLFYGGGWELFGIQSLSVLAAMAYAAFLTAGILYAIKLTIGVRVKVEDENVGLDLGDHGEAAYDVPAITSDAPAPVDVEPVVMEPAA